MKLCLRTAGVILVAGALLFAVPVTSAAQRQSGRQASKRKKPRTSAKLRRQTAPPMKPVPTSEHDAPRVVVKFKDSLNLPYVDHVETHDTFRANVLWGRLRKKFSGISLMRLHTSVSAEQMKRLEERAQALGLGNKLSASFEYFYVVSPLGTDLEALAGALRSLPVVETAYVYYPAPPPVISQTTCSDPVAQGHLGPAPLGIDALYAQKVPGGNGERIRFIDIERGWFLNHEAIATHKPTLLCRSVILNDVSEKTHGTSVLGVIHASNNPAGCAGVAPGVDKPVNLVSQYRSTESKAIWCAITHLREGDVLLIEAQAFDRKKSLYAPVEINRAELDAIQWASRLGIVVIEPGGNGNEYDVGYDLDAYTNPEGLRTLYRHPANTHFVDSGAILVSAAIADKAPRNFGWSPYGSRVDCFAWGEQVGTASVVTDDKMHCYQDQFGGTSSAAAIVAGAALSVQGVAKARLGRPFPPSKLRELLSSTRLDNTRPVAGSRSIGVMPNLRAILDSVKH
jgi:hypothetical protein